MYQLLASGYVQRNDGAIIPADPANRDYAEYLAWRAAGNTPDPVPGPSPEQVEAAVVAAVQQRLDTFARTRGYDGILSAATYATSTVAKFAAEGQCAVNARDAHWNACYQILADVQSGARAMPTVDEVLAEMPALAWPQ